MYSPGSIVRLATSLNPLSVLLLHVPHDMSSSRVVKKIEAKGRKSVWITGDVATEEDVKNAVEKTVSSLGSLDIVRRMLL